MPKIAGEDGTFRFYWGNSTREGTPKADIKVILNELMAQYADHVWNLFGTEEPESKVAKHNLDGLTEVHKELK